MINRETEIPVGGCNYANIHLLERLEVDVAREESSDILGILDRTLLFEDRFARRSRDVTLVAFGEYRLASPIAPPLPSG